MTIRQIVNKALIALDTADDEAFRSRIDGYGTDSYGSPIYQDGYGEDYFPVRLDTRKAAIVAEILSDYGCFYWLDEPVKVNPKAVYYLWVSVERVVFGERLDKLSWGLSRTTVSPYWDTLVSDAVTDSDVERSRRRVRR
jgi:hypothetical protein